MNKQWRELLNSLKNRGVLKKRAVAAAFRAIDRKDFVLNENKNFAYDDQALPILDRQTISQPYTVAFMLDLLDPKQGDVVLDIGAGSGWQTALLSHVVGKKGKVYAMEINEDLCDFGVKNILKYKFLTQKTAEWLCKSAVSGLPEKAPFDKIIAAATINKNQPKIWLKQLKVGGRMVVPIDNSLWLFAKKKGDDYDAKEFPGFVFVPFV